MQLNALQAFPLPNFGRTCLHEPCLLVRRNADDWCRPGVFRVGTFFRGVSVKLNCKPGDLAIVVRAETPGLLGAMVQVVRFVPMGRFAMPEGIVMVDAPAWIISSASGRTLPAMREFFGSVVQVKERPFPDSCLRPIRPDEEPEQVLRNEEMTA